MFNWIKNFFTPKPVAPKPHILGIVLDTRTPDEVAQQDPHISEVVGGALAAVNWQEKKPEDIRQFPDQNQDGQSSCVWQTVRKCLRILTFVNHGLDLDFSALYGYRQRSNYPEEGSSYEDAVRISGAGVTLNALMPSDDISEAQANALVIKQYHRDIAAQFPIPKWVRFDAKDLETVASTIQVTRKGVMVWIFATVSEWSQQVPVITTALTGPGDPRSVVVHSLTGVEPALFNGKKGLWIEDSAHFGQITRRFITEDFYKARNFLAAYPLNFKFEPGAETDPSVVMKPHFVPGNNVSLQDCLRYEGVFPSNVQSTGVVGPITTQAIKDLQTKYSLEAVGTVGPKTTALLKRLYP